jgi:tetratricopeptide (TPR) repeat protein
LTSSGKARETARSRLRLYRLSSEGRTAEANRLADSMLAESPNDVDILYQKGANYFQAKQFGEAIKLFDAILRLDDRNADAWRAKGICLAEQQRYADAIPAYRESLDCRPGDPHTLNEMGKALLHLGRHAEASKAFHDAIEGNSRFGEAWHYLAVALERNGQPDDALGAFDRAVRVDPANADAWHDRGCFFGREAQKCLDQDNLRGLGLLYEALRSFECALSVSPNHALASQHRVSILDLLGPKLANERPAPHQDAPTCDDAEEHQ